MLENCSDNENLVKFEGLKEWKRLSISADWILN